VDSSGWPGQLAARYRDRGYWRGQTFGEMLAARAKAQPYRPAVVDYDRRWTYGELNGRARRLANGLRELGIGRGDRVVVQLPNIAEFLEVVFALFLRGAWPVLALPAHREAEITGLCRDAEAVACVIADRHAGFDHRNLARAAQRAVPSLKHVLVVGEPGEFTALHEVRSSVPLPVTEPGPVSSDIALLQLSGGTTGRPKLIPRTHDDYLYTLRRSAEICRLGPYSVYLAVLPVAHNYPLSSPGALGTLYAGGTVVLSPAPSPEIAFPLIAGERVTITGLVPPLAMIWLDAAKDTEHDLSSLRVLQVGGAKFAEHAAARVRPVFGCALQQVFGMAEGLVNYTRLDDPEHLVLSTQGRPMCPDDEILIVDEQGAPVPPGQTGELLTRGPYTIRGYHRATAHDEIAFTPDGFYRTGDLVRLLPSGHLVVEGRATDRINRGGEKISAEEVENHLLAHASVRDAVVVGVPDETFGERVCAFVIPRGDAPTPFSLRGFLRERGIAAFKIPDRWEIVSAFPWTGVGKVSRRDLRRAATAQLRQQKEH
jgi:2,3-dihydroxybenzoate-AMP ligase